MTSWIPSALIGKHPRKLAWGLGFALTLIGALPAPAEPTWFSGKISEAPALATNTNRWIVFYFQTEKAINCIRMATETWPVMEASEADKNFIWVQLDPQKNASQFKYYEVMVTPEIILVDPKGRERARLRGFVDSQTLLKLLSDVYETEKSNNSDTPPEPIVMTPDGKYMKKSEYLKMVNANQDKSFSMSFFSEDFDDTPSFEMLDPKRFIPTILTSTRIDPADGRYSSPALYVGADVSTGSVIPMNPSAQLVIDLSHSQTGTLLSATDLDQGRMRVSFSIRAKFMPGIRSDCMELKIVGANEKWNAPSKKSFRMNLVKTETLYRDKFLVTDVFNVKQSKAYLILWVDYPSFGFWIDNLKVELLPPNEDVSLAAAGAATERDPTSALQLMAPPETKEGDQWFGFYDKNKDSRIQPDELSKREFDSLEFLIGMKFTQADKNKDNYLDAKEWEAIGKKKL